MGIRLAVRLEVHEQRGLQSGKREIEIVAIDHAARECDRPRIAFAGETIDDGAAGIAEPEQLRCLVERFAGGVVSRRAENAIATEAFDDDELGVSARHEQRDVRHQLARGDAIVTEHGGEDVAFHVVHADERQAGRDRESARALHSDQQCADEAGAFRHRERVELVEALEAGIGERTANDGHHGAEVMPARELGHDTAELRMHFDLRAHHARAHDVVVDDRGCGLVTRALDREDAGHGQGFAAPPSTEDAAMRRCSRCSWRRTLCA